MAGDVVLNARDFEQAVENAFPHRFNVTTLSAVARNLASSWTQSGHFAGKVVKRRTHPEVTPENCAFALLLGFAEGIRGKLLLDSAWVRICDADQQEMARHMREASRRGLLDLRLVGSVVDIHFDCLLTPRELEVVHGKN